MFGRVRACSLSSLEVLEMERNPKLLKDDSLSIYEKTLMKLQEGSKRNLSLIPEESMEADDDTSPSMAANEAESVVVNGSDDASTGSDDSQSMIIAKEKPCKNLSVVYLFSRYKASRNGNISSSDDSSMTVAMEDDYSSADTSSTRDHGLQQGCIADSSSPI
ncbi:hypothetical protein OSB04_004204 [Centaurea solstitialis]|uniref:Uncharacterized protein n=1 Tax=Centaurea solstitialis TaxID=347529 RepID=A0AA38UDI7_9ASTR|nr:hypothetical protein OSB04_004204 [Centaurea solstitialis]